MSSSSSRAFILCVPSLIKNRIFCLPPQSQYFSISALAVCLKSPGQNVYENWLQFKNRKRNRVKEQGSFLAFKEQGLMNTNCVLVLGGKCAMPVYKVLTHIHT
jgi:hypothetical protein